MKMLIVKGRVRGKGRKGERKERGGRRGKGREEKGRGKKGEERGR